MKDQPTPPNYTATDTPSGDQLADELREQIAEYSHRLSAGGAPSPEELAAAEETCNEAVGLYWALFLELSSQMGASELQEAIHSRGLDPISAALTDAFRELRRASHELGLEVARHKRAIGTISQEEADWLDLMESEPEGLADSEPAPGVFDPVMAQEFLAAIGKNGTTRARAFPAKGRKGTADKGGLFRADGSVDAALVQQWQNNGLGAYFVVNNGGDRKAEITEIIGYFAEFDDGTKTEQFQRLNSSPLPAPSYVIDNGGRSLHLYWILDEPIICRPVSDCPDKAQWTAEQERIANVLGSDPFIKDPSRVMRLPGAWYIKPDGSWGGQARVCAGTGQRVSRADFLACLPEPEPLPEAPLAVPPIGLGEPSPCNGDDDLPPRPLEQVLEALRSIPPRIPGNGTYPDDRAAALGFIHAVVEAGGTIDLALSELQAHHPLWRGLFQAVQSSDLSAWGSGTFWHYVKQRGGSAGRPDLKGKRQAVPRAATSNGHRTTALSQQQELDPDDAADDRAALALELEQFRDLSQMAAMVTLERVFPSGLASSITAYANEQQLEPRGFIPPILTTAISVIGNRAMVAAEPGNDWREPSVLWCMNICEAGGGKTPTSKPAISDALKHWQKREVDKHKRELTEWKRGKAEAERKAKNANEEDWGDDCDDPVADFLAKNPQPDLRHITVTDATFEKIETILAGDNNPGLLAYYDELARWFQQLCRNPQQNDRSKWLSLYPGSPIKTDRIGRESVLVTDPAVSIFGSIQPNRLEGLWKADAAANDGEADGDGLWSRFLLFNLGDWNYRYRSSTVRLAPVLENLYEQINAAAKKLQRRSDGDATVLALASDALPLFIAWIDQLEGLKRVAREPSDRQYLSKQRGTTLRLALALHVIHQAGRSLPLDTPISKDTLQAAILLTALFMVEREKALAPLRSQVTGAIKRLLAKGREWRREHGATPVPVKTLRGWCLPERNAKAKAVRDWLKQVVSTTPYTGRVEWQGQGLVWVPPGD